MVKDIETYSRVLYSGVSRHRSNVLWQSAALDRLHRSSGATFRGLGCVRRGGSARLNSEVYWFYILCRDVRQDAPWHIRRPMVPGLKFPRVQRFNDGTIGFQVATTTPPCQLVIDPVLVYHLCGRERRRLRQSIVADSAGMHTCWRFVFVRFSYRSSTTNSEFL